MLKKTMSTVMMLSFVVLSACGTRAPDPVRVTRADDGLKNCAVLANDIEALEFQIHQILPKTDKLMKNIGYGVAGLYTFFIPWMLIDFKNAEAKEYEALRARHEHLAGLATAKNCGLTAQDYPTMDELKKEQRRIKALKNLGKDKNKDIEAEDIEADVKSISDVENRQIDEEIQRTAGQPIRLVN